MFPVGPAFFGSEDPFNPTLTPGSETTIAVPAICTWVGAVALSSTKAIVLYSGSGQPLRAIVADVSGNTITPATAVSVEGTWCVMAKAVALSSTSALVVYTRQSDGVMFARVLSVSGSTITVNAEATLTMGAASVFYFAIELLDSTHVLVGRGNSPGGYDFMVVTISGTTVSANAVYTHATLASVTTSLYLVALSSSSVAVVYQDYWTAGMISNSGSRGMVLSISGTTITLPVGPQDLIHQYFPNGAHQYLIKKISNTRVAFALQPNVGTAFSVMEFDVAAGLFIPVGGQVSSVSNAIANAGAYCFDLVEVTNKNLIAITMDSPNQDLSGIAFQASSSGPVLGAKVLINNNASPLTYPAAAQLSATKKLIAFTDSSSVLGIVFDVT